MRVIATNTVGDSEPSEVVSGTPTPPPESANQVVENTPAEGAPGIDGTAEVGQTLSAVTTVITDVDGLDNVVFSYQWLADDMEIAGGVGETYTLADMEEGKEIKVRVNFTDDAGNEESITSAATAAVAAAAELELESATVDGATLTLTYNESLETGVTLPTSAFVVNVNGSTRTIMGAGVGQSSVLLLVSPGVVAGDTVTVDYTKPSGTNVIKDTEGREADSFTAQTVTNNTASTEVERSDSAPPPDSPTSVKAARHESGKLSTSWDAPDSGPVPTGYTVQWKLSGADWNDADDVSESDVTKTSHVITGLTDGVQYAVRVIAHNDAAESAPSREVTATPQETAPPAPSSASVAGATLAITFDEPLDAGETPDKSAFAVTVAGNSRGVDTVSVSGSAVTLTLASAVEAGEAVTVDYTAPTGESADRLQDLAGNAASSFSGQDVTNNSQAADRLTATVSAVPESHDGSTVFTFELRFSETPRKGFSYKIMRDLAFTVTGGEVVNARRLEKGKNVGWEIHVRPDGNGPVTIVLPVTTDCTAEGATCTEDRRPLSNRLETTIPGPGTQQDSTNQQQQEQTRKDNTGNQQQQEQTRKDNTGNQQQQEQTRKDNTGNQQQQEQTGNDNTGNQQQPTPLSASAYDVPASHDGSAAFTFELRFSETPRKGFSYKIMRDLAFTVTGGEVVKARRLAPPGNIRWEITVRPDGNGTVTIVLPTTTDCEGDGAICTGDGRTLSNRLEVTIPGTD